MLEDIRKLFIEHHSVKNVKGKVIREDDLRWRMLEINDHFQLQKIKIELLEEKVQALEKQFSKKKLKNSSKI